MRPKFPADDLIRSPGRKRKFANRLERIGLNRGVHELAKRLAGRGWSSFQLPDSSL